MTILWKNFRFFVNKTHELSFIKFLRNICIYIYINIPLFSAVKLLHPFGDYRILKDLEEYFEDFTMLHTIIPPVVSVIYAARFFVF